MTMIRAAFYARVSGEARKRSDSYFECGYVLIFVDGLYAVAVAALLLWTGISAQMRNLAQRFTRSRFLQAPIYVVMFIAATAVLTFPLTVYEGFFREHAYGLSNQNIWQWLGDFGIQFALTFAASVLLLPLLYFFIRRTREMWWLWGAGLAIAFQILVIVIWPLFIAPLYNHYSPLPDSPLKTKILSMARANEIPVTQVFEVDASRQTTRVSANVSGFLGTTRIALNDNLLKQCTLPEIRMVMAHEMGHYVLNHGGKLTTYLGIFVLIGFALTRTLFEAAVRRRGEKWGVRGIADLAGLPLLALILMTFAFVITPLSNTVTRVTEREADAFGINTSREPDGMAKVSLKLGAYRKLDPSPLEEFIFFDHPSGRARIRMAMDWKAAHLPAGESATSGPSEISP